MAKNPVNPKILIILILTKEEVRRMGDKRMESRLQVERSGLKSNMRMMTLTVVFLSLIHI